MNFKTLKNDIPSGLVVFLVALPLCLGIALASGAPLFSGIIAGIIGGIVVASISGSALGVSGPAAGLISIVIAAINDLGGFDAFLLAVVLAGFIQILMGLFKAGVIAYYFPNSVIKGMLTGIGIIIILKQIPHAFGYDKDPEGDFGFVQKDGHNTLTELYYMLDFITPGAVLITVISLFILILWERPFMKKISALKIVPGPLVAVLSGLLINVLMGQDSYFSLSHEHEVNIPIATGFGDFISKFTGPDWSAWNNSNIYVVALTIALVASLETLLCVEATDKLDPQKRVTPTNRELIAQGTGNMVSGLIGGLPITQVIVRSSANIQTGGKTKLSAIFHGILLFLSVLFLSQFLNLIPLASLATILFIVGYKLAKPSLIIGMYKKGWGQFTPFIITVVTMVFTNLLIGIGVGLAVGLIQILWSNFKTPYHLRPDQISTDSPIKIELSQHVSFLNKASILHTLDTLPSGCHLIMDATKANFIHPDILEIFEDFETQSENNNIKFELIGL